MIRRLLTAVTVLILLLFGAGQVQAATPVTAAIPIATIAQTQAEINVVDPQHLIDWHLSLPAGYGSDTYGLALPWNDEIFLQGGYIPLVLLKGTILHEYAHMLQYQFTQFQPQTFVNFETLLNQWVKKAPGLDISQRNVNGIEYLADCMSMSKGGDGYFYGCPAALNTIVPQSRFWTPPPAHPVPSPPPLLPTALVLNIPCLLKNTGMFFWSPTSQRVGLSTLSGYIYCVTGNHFKAPYPPLIQAAQASAHVHPLVPLS